MTHSKGGWGTGTQQQDYSQQQLYVFVNQSKWGYGTIRGMPNGKPRLPPSTRSRATVPKLTTTGAGSVPNLEVSGAILAMQLTADGSGQYRPQSTSGHATLGSIGTQSIVKLPPLIEAATLSISRQTTTGSGQVHAPVSATGYIVSAIDAGGSGTAQALGEPGMIYHFQLGKE